MELERADFHALEDEGFEVRDDYAGRGMYGSQCLALIGGVRDLFRFSRTISEWVEAGELDQELLDAMEESIQAERAAVGLVFYFPDVTVGPA